MTYLQVGRWVLLSWAVPVIGGVIGYWKTRQEDVRLAQVLLAGTFGIPVILIGMVLGSLFMASTGAILGAALAAVMTPGVFRWYLEENPYRDMLWASYLYVPGALYLYLGPYSERPRPRRAAKTFLIWGTVIGVSMAGLVTLVFL